MATPPPPKRIIDEVSGWLRIYSDNSVDRTFTGPPSFLPLLSPVPPHSSPTTNISLLDLPGHPSLRLYLPSSLPPLSPILLHFHGGGFCISNSSWLMYHHFYSRLSRSLPAIIASVDLPLAPEHPLPAAFHAAFQALVRLRDSPHLLPSSADFSRVFLIGDSSGGNIVHHVSAMVGEKPPGFLHPIKLAGGIAIHPGFLRCERGGSEARVEWETAFLTREMLEKFLGLALPEGAGKEHAYVCPMGEGRMEGVRMPAMMVAIAERDLVRDGEEEYCEGMRRAGKEVEVVFQRGVGHSFYLDKFGVEEDEVIGKRTEELVLAIKDFVDRH